MTLAFFLLLPAVALAQCGTPNGWTTVDSTAALRDLASCTTLRGSLRVSGSVNDLSPLRNLESIELSIDITGTQLTSLSGLDSLREIGDKLFVHSNARLNSLRGAPLLATVVGGVLVYDQALLTDLDGLQSITTLNPSGSVQYPFGVRVYRNKKLTSLNGLQNLRDLGNQLELSQLPLLRNLEGLPAGPITVRNITLIENEALTDISLLSTYVTDQGGCALEFTRNKNLVSMNGLQGIDKWTNMIITSNSRLADVSALSNAEIKGPIVDISDNGRLCDFQGVNTTAAAVAGANVDYSCGTGTGSGSATIVVSSLLVLLAALVAL